MSEEKTYSFGRTLKGLDFTLFFCIVILYFIGVAFIYSAASGINVSGIGFARRQLMWGGLSIVAFGGILKIGYRRFLSWGYWIYGGILFCLVLVLLTGVVAKGAQSWFSFGGFRLQPSELGKISLALLLAKLSVYGKLETLTGFLKVWALSGCSLVLVLLQPDLGSSLVYATMIFAALWASGCRKRHFFSLIGLGLAMLPVGWHFLKGYQKQRLMVFVDPSLDPLGAGYNVIQSRIAVGSGSIWGKGFLQGTQSKLRFLPEPHTDFIFSVFSEECGFIGGVIVLAIFSLLFWRTISIAIKTKDKQAKVMIAALTAWIWFQVFECVGMSMGLLPVTGLPLPLLSYGGSALVATSAALGLIASVGMTDEMERQTFER